SWMNWIVMGKGLAMRSVVLVMIALHSLSAYWMSERAVPKPTVASQVTFQTRGPLSSGLLWTSSSLGVRSTWHCSTWGPGSAAGGGARPGASAGLTGVRDAGV